MRVDKIWEHKIWVSMCWQVPVLLQAWYLHHASGKQCRCRVICVDRRITMVTATAQRWVEPMFSYCKYIPITQWIMRVWPVEGILTRVQKRYVYLYVTGVFYWLIRLSFSPPTRRISNVCSTTTGKPLYLHTLYIHNLYSSIELASPSLYGNSCIPP